MLDLDIGNFLFINTNGILTRYNVFGGSILGRITGIDYEYDGSFKIEYKSYLNIK